MIEQLAKLLGRPILGLVLCSHPRLGGFLDELLADRMDAGINRSDRTGASRAVCELGRQLIEECIERFHG